MTRYIFRRCIYRKSFNGKNDKNVIKRLKCDPRFLYVNLKKCRAHILSKIALTQSLSLISVKWNMRASSLGVAPGSGVFGRLGAGGKLGNVTSSTSLGTGVEEARLGRLGPATAAGGASGSQDGGRGSLSPGGSGLGVVLKSGLKSRG